MTAVTHATDHVTFTVEAGDTSHMINIIRTILPQLMDRFAAKNRQYGENDFVLGPKGQVPEIWRKCCRLRAILWDERVGADAFEDASEVIDDLVGHLLMLKDCMLKEDLKGERTAHVETPEWVLKQAAEFMQKTFAVPTTEVYKDGPISQFVPHKIREAKNGEETWTPDGEEHWTPRKDPELPFVEESYPANWKGRHAYQVENNAVMHAHGWQILVARPGEVRCGWRYGNPDDSPLDNQCVGVEGHNAVHINRMLDAWSV